MFRKSTPKPTNTTLTPIKPAGPRKAVPSVVSADMNILGNIVTDGTVDLDGILDGNIRCTNLVLRHNGKVNGEIHAESVHVHGRVKGLIKAKSVHLHATCNVEGIIMHEMISIEDGAMIDGKFKRTNKVAPAVNTDEEDTTSEDDDFDNLSPQQMLENLRLIAG